MQVRAVIAFFALLSAPVAQARVLLPSPALSPDAEQFQVKEKTEVPNLTLQPGTYSIRILDHLSDRVILQLSGKGSHVQTTFLAVPAATMANAPVGPILYSTGPKGSAALKGFAFPGGTAVEFVYPKNSAVSIAQANGTRVMAIDPASEGKVEAPKLSQNDMQMVTLWMLEPQRVGPTDKPTISANRYQPAPAATQTAQTAPTPAAAAAPVAPTAPSASETAAVSTPAAPAVAPVPPASAAAQPADQASPAPAPAVEVARNEVPPRPAPVRHHARPANVTALPHTASLLPVMCLLSLASLLLGAGLSLRRLTVRL